MLGFRQGVVSSRPSQPPGFPHGALSQEKRWMVPSAVPTSPLATHESMPCSCLNAQKGCRRAAASTPHSRDRRRASSPIEEVLPNAYTNRCCPQSSGLGPVIPSRRDRSTLTSSRTGLGGPRRRDAFQVTVCPASTSTASVLTVSKPETLASI
jgi:hypothetical protein